MVLLIIILSLAALLLWTLFAPLILFVDTGQQRYILKIPGIIHARFVPDERDPYIRVWILFIPIRIKPYGRIREKAETKQKGKRRMKIPPAFLIMAVKDFIRSSRLRLFRLDMDTGDYALNSLLVPVLMLTSSKRIRINVNFSDENKLFMDLRNKLANLFWIGIKYLYLIY